MYAIDKLNGIAPVSTSEVVSPFLLIYPTHDIGMKVFPSTKCKPFGNGIYS
jgi:hypothetical protein